MKNFETPRPKSEIENPNLTRPDWTNIPARPTDILRVDKNENPDPKIAEIALKILRGLPPEAINGYPDLSETYAKLAKLLGIEANQLLFAAGSDGAIRAVFETFISPGDLVMHSDPTFAMYYVYSKIFGAQTHPITYEPSPNGPYLDLNGFCDQISAKKPRLVCLPNPDSPTGTVLSPEEMKTLIETAAKADSVILIDEAYHPFWKHSVVPWINQYPNLIVTQTFAKAWGLAGTRIGYACAQTPMIELLHKVRPMYETNTIGLHVVDQMLDHSDEVKESVVRLEAGKDYFLDEMKSMGFEIFRSHGNFFHVRFGDLAPAIHATLRGMALYREDFNHPALKGCSRFSSALKEQFEPIVAAIRSVVSESKN